MSLLDNEENLYKRQHYVSHGYLRHFAVKHEGKANFQICAFQKKEHRLFVTGVNKVSYKKGCYNVTTRDDPKYWEKYFSKEIEPAYVSALDYVISKVVMTRRGLPILTDTDKQAIGKLIAFQIMRIPSFMDNRIDEGLEIGSTFWTSLQKKYGSRISKNQADRISEYILKEGGIKDLYLENISSETNLERYSNVLRDRTWLLLCNNTSMPFITSDNPVLVYSAINITNPSSNGGIGLFDANIYYPISPKVMLYIVPRWIIDLKCGVDDRHFLDNEELDIVHGVNEKQYHHATMQVYCSPLYEKEFAGYLRQSQRL